MESSVKSFADYWWLVVLRGVIALGFGLAAIVNPTKTIMFLVVLVSLYLLIEGAILVLVSLFSIKKVKNWWLGLCIGLFTILAGFTIANWPQATLTLIFFVVGVWAIVAGILMLVQAVSIRKESYGSWILVALAILSLLFGIFLFSNPVGTVSAVTMLVGLFAFVSGLLTIAMGMEMRSLKNDIKKVEANMNV